MIMLLLLLLSYFRRTPPLRALVTKGVVLSQRKLTCGSAAPCLEQMPEARLLLPTFFGEDRSDDTVGSSSSRDQLALGQIVCVSSCGKWA